jgi:peptidoglycan hydrolase CwlO-like protein
MPVCVSIATAGPPGWVIDGVILAVSLAIIGYAAHQVLAADVRKPLTNDEEKKIDHLEKDTEGFLKKHPDLEEEARKKAAGEALTKGEHPDEAKDWVKGLENDITHLKKVRRSRDDESQAAIDRAIEHGENWIDKIIKKLYGKK